MNLFSEPSIALLGISPGEMKTYFYVEICTQRFVAALFVVTQNKKLPKSKTHSQKTRNYLIKINKKHRSIYSYNIQIHASSQSRLTQALYQTRYEEYFETLKFKKKIPQIRNPPTNNML